MGFVIMPLMKLPIILQTIADILQKHEAKAIVVGGSVRDHFLGLSIKDYDVEVYGLESLEALEKILSTFGSVNLVGKSFGVLKFMYDGEEYDFSFPRTEEKTGSGHRGFDVKVDGSMAFKEAARRRDFTLNAMGYDISAKTFLDPYGGREDMAQKLIRHIDARTFVEDPLRVYRAVQFSARFGYELADETKRLCGEMVNEGMLEDLPKERVYTEWVKLLLKSEKPSVGFELMRELGILRYFPELEALSGIPQDPVWHPEGDVWVHTMMTLDAMAKEIVDRQEEIEDKDRLKYMFAILCHDLGKATHTTIETDGKIRAIGHEEAGLEPTRSLLYRLTNEHDFIESLLPLVEHHLKPSQFYKARSKDKAIRKLSTKVNIGELVIVAKADFLGRTTPESLSGVYPAGEWLLEKARNLKVENKPLDNLLQGRDLIALGLSPSPKFKEILDAVYEAQIEGEINDRDAALGFVKERYLKNL